MLSRRLSRCIGKQYSLKSNHPCRAFWSGTGGSNDDDGANNPQVCRKMASISSSYSPD